MTQLLNFATACLWFFSACLWATSNHLGLVVLDLSLAIAYFYFTFFNR
jgi:hypothetical protein